MAHVAAAGNLPQSQEAVSGGYETLPRQRPRRSRALSKIHLLRHGTRVVRREADIDAVVDVEPFRVVIEHLGVQRAPAHKAPGRVKVGKHEAALEAIDAALENRAVQRA